MDVLYLVTQAKYDQFCNLGLLMTHFNEKTEAGGDILRFKTATGSGVISKLSLLRLGGGGIIEHSSTERGIKGKRWCFSD